MFLAQAVDLRQTGYPGRHLQPSTLPFRVVDDFVGRFGTGPNHAHLATNHVPHLGKFREASTVKEAFEARLQGSATVDVQAMHVELGVSLSTPHFRPESGDTL